MPRARLLGVRVLIDLSSHLIGVETFHRGCNDARVAYKRYDLHKYRPRNRLRIDASGNRPRESNVTRNARKNALEFPLIKCANEAF